MQAEFRAPRRRARVQEEYEGSLPVSRRPEERSLFRAELINQHVLIRDPEHIQKIHNQGFFGKGVLSRARPDHSISDQWEEHEGLFLPLVSLARYQELLRWAGATLSAQGLDEEAVNQTLLKLSQPVGMEDLRGEGQVENGQEGAGPEGGASPCTEMANHNPDSDSFSDSDSEPIPGPGPGPGPGSLVPGPGFVLVVSDSEAAVRIREVRRTPLLLSEYLQLSLEEAFFLVYGLGCLSVHMHQEPLSIIQLWRKFQSLRPDFVSSYAAYHHFRSRGWVPKEGGGAKYGVNLMLYRKGPPFYHASYSVVIERANDAFEGSPLRPFSWRSLAALSRITANVSKELMLCYVIYPADQSQAELDSPECLNRLQVQEVIISRWVSSRERAEQDDI
ncbi:tRNA-splicing endonuclease subunit Sen2 [Acanthochromis polyacanthus]|uniref:tRNA-splicing endonuclease subunit Sen2 n=1 Tax=Acanthochromis polyacanthus TaxID=80966 RepID=UPI0022347B4F|nr:tRNA-splicing endonuclease subunit Sen2 [Acanthochromis polyacanthus]